jgi:endonuclease G
LRKIFIYMATNKKKQKKRTDNKVLSLPKFIILLAVVSALSVYGRFTGDSSSSSADATSSTASVSHTEGLEIPVAHSKVGGQTLKRTGYTLCYNADFKTPIWVAWELTKEEVTTGNEKRADTFVADPDVRGAKAYTKDYTGSGYDRGHMAPAGDMKWSKQAMEESFYLSNICPQVPNLNRGDWNDLEETCRKWAKKYGRIYIACGPIYESKNPKRIGNNKVGVPDAFYKVVLLNVDKDPQAIGFIFPNESGNNALEHYVRSVDEVEEITQIDFFPALEDDIENRIEAVKWTELPKKY